MDKKEAEEEKVPLAQKKLNYFESMMNFIKGLLGVGILGGPYGFHQLGWLFAFIIASIVMFILTYSTRILVMSMQKVRSLRELNDINYPDAVREGFKEGPKCLQKMSEIAPIIVKFFLALYHFNCGPVYIVIICQSVRDVVSQYYTDMDVRIYMALAIVPLILINLINNLKVLTPFSILATLMILLGLIFIVYYMVSTKLPSFSDLDIVNCMSCLPIYVGLLLLTCASPGVILAIERAMKVPEQFIAYYGVLNIGMFFIYILVVSFSLAGYWRYGKHTKDNILLNIPVEEQLSQATKILYAIAIYFSYPLQMFPCVQIIWTEGLSLKCSPKRRIWYEILFRIAIVFATVIVAISIPFFHIIASLNGCVAITMLGIALPCLLDIALRYPNQYGPAHMALVRDILFIIFSVIFCISGIVLSIIELYNEFKH